MLKRIAMAVAALLGLAGLALAAWYQIDGQPRPETAALLNGQGYQSREEPDGSLLFLPGAPNGRGLLVFHGALIKPRSYAATAAYFAARGYTVFIPAGPGRLSIQAVDSAAARLPTLGVADWYLLGHSMGGYASLDLVRRHRVSVRAAALWAAAMPVSFADLDLPLLALWGDRDGLMPAARFAEARERLPGSARFMTIPGGNHQDFAMYTHQFFDQPGTLGWQAQIATANARTAAFFDEVAARQGGLPAGGAVRP